MDIEGAERELLKFGDLAWLGCIGELLVELHEIADENIQTIFFEALSGYAYESKKLGEYEWIIFQPV
jgi:hypothetical protein